MPGPFRDVDISDVIKQINQIGANYLRKYPEPYNGWFGLGIFAHTNQPQATNLRNINEAMLSSSPDDKEKYLSLLEIMVKNTPTFTRGELFKAIFNLFNSLLVQEMKIHICYDDGEGGSYDYDASDLASMMNSRCEKFREFIDSPQDGIQNYQL